MKFSTMSRCRRGAACRAPANLFMLPVEVIRKVRRIEISTRRVVNDILAGEYRSTYRGRGMEFSEVREYQRGDDVRTIDWNVTARMGAPFVKIFQEERELTVIIMVDLSSSGEFGSVRRPKRELGIEVAALLAFSAIRNNDRVGLIAFTDRVERYVPPKKSKKHALRLISELVRLEPAGARTNLRGALEYLMRVQRKRAVVFILSDFLDENFEHVLRGANRKHDIVALTLSDPREIELPDVGLLWLEDAETGEQRLIDTSERDVRRKFLMSSAGKRAAREKLFRSSDLDAIPLFTNSDYTAPLIGFFRRRAKRFR